MIYGLFGSLLAVLFSAVTISYFTGVVKYVTDMFTVQFELNGLDFSEAFFLVVLCVFIGWLSAKLRQCEIFSVLVVEANTSGCFREIIADKTSS